MRVSECGSRPDRCAQPAAVADRFAREIGRFLSAILVRSRRLSGKPLGRSPITSLSDWSVIGIATRTAILY
jgi:hypothetical protein